MQFLRETTDEKMGRVHGDGVNSGVVQAGGDTSSLDGMGEVAIGPIGCKVKLRSRHEAVLQLLMEADVDGLIGASRHERSAERIGSVQKTV